MQRKFETLLRQWKMLQLIPRRRRIDARTLREKLLDDGFRADIRTIQRDLQSLSSIFPLTHDEGCKPIGWSWAEDALVFDVPGMDLSTALTLLLANQHLAHLMPRSCLETLGPHTERARHILNDNSRTALGNWPDKVRMIPRSMPLRSPSIDPGHFDRITEALLAEKRIRIQYRRKNSRESRWHEANPLGLVLNDQIMYLVATLWEYQRPILLALHRIEDIDTCEGPFVAPPDFDLDEYIARGAMGFPVDADLPPILLQALFDAEQGSHLRESPLSEDQHIQEVDNGSRLLVSATVPDTSRLRWWLLGFGAHVEVRGPAPLRAEIAATVQRMAMRYAQPNTSTDDWCSRT